MSNDINIEQKLQEIEERVEDNYKILKSIKRKQTLDFWFGIVKVLVFIGAFYSLYIFIEPVLNQVKDTYLQFQGLSDSVGSFDIKFFDFFKDQQTQ